MSMFIIINSYGTMKTSRKELDAAAQQANNGECQCPACITRRALNDELKNRATPSEGTDFYVGGAAGVGLAPDQFAYVDYEAGTAIFEDINADDSRVRAELVKRGWTPPGETNIIYPEVKRNDGGFTTEGVAYIRGWNECRTATMRLNRKS